MHKGRLKGVALDCVGLLVEVAKELGLPWVDRRAYSMRPDGHMLLESLSSVMVPTVEPSVGCVVTFGFISPAWSAHAGIVTDEGLIHTWREVGKVVETDFPQDYIPAITGYWLWRP